MRKLLCAISMAALLVSMTACNSSQDNFTPDYESAIGAIFINNEQELPENTKVYADFADNSYSFVWTLLAYIISLPVQMLLMLEIRTLPV